MTTDSVLDHSVVKWQKPWSLVLRSNNKDKNAIFHEHVMANKLCGRCQTEFTDWNNSVCTSVEKEFTMERTFDNVIIETSRVGRRDVIGVQNSAACLAYNITSGAVTHTTTTYYSYAY